MELGLCADVVLTRTPNTQTTALPCWFALPAPAAFASSLRCRGILFSQRWLTMQAGSNPARLLRSGEMKVRVLPVAHSVHKGDPAGTGKHGRPERRSLPLRSKAAEGLSHVTIQSIIRTLSGLVPLPSRCHSYHKPDSTSAYLGITDPMTLTTVPQC